jgi:3',5'-cyclic AMP phosphodiesterase CpdA
MRIAHVSDLHVLSPLGVEWRKILFNKRITALANLLLVRARMFRRDYLDAVLAAAARNADHVVVTGDVTNMSLESEYEEAGRMLQVVARSVEVTVVPGNHDVYLPHIRREGRFARHLSSFFTSDLPELAIDAPGGRFPCVRLRGPVAIIGLSSGVPRPPFVSSGHLGRQLEALGRILVHPEVASRTPIVLVHHDPIDSRFRLEQLRGGLTDAHALRDALRNVARGLVLFGHVHVRKRTELVTAAGVLQVVSAGAAAVDHPNDAVRAGYNLYEIDRKGCVVSQEAWVLDPATRDVARGGPSSWHSRYPRHESTFGFEGTSAR